MDTCINLSDYSSSSFISPQELESLLNRADTPLLIDLRPQTRFDASSRMLAGARRCSLENLPALAAMLFAENPHQEVVTYCVYGHQVSMAAAADLLAAGLNARSLAGGFEGGEDGVDSPQEITRWRSILLPTVAKGTP